MAEAAIMAEKSYERLPIGLLDLFAFFEPLIENRNDGELWISGSVDPKLQRVAGGVGGD